MRRTSGDGCCFPTWGTKQFSWLCDEFGCVLMGGMLWDLRFLTLFAYESPSIWMVGQRALPQCSTLHTVQVQQTDDTCPVLCSVIFSAPLGDLH